MSYKVIIVGAGSGGAQLAYELARRDIEVVLYEQSSFSKLGHDWSDAVDKGALLQAGFSLPRRQDGRWVGSNVKNENKETNREEVLFEPHVIDPLLVYSPDFQAVKEIKFPLIVTDRRDLNQALVRRAEKAGAEVKYQHRGEKLIVKKKGKGLTGVKVSGVKIKDLKTGKIKESRADLVVEADGFNSSLRTSLPFKDNLTTYFKEEDFALVYREVRSFNPGQLERKLPDYYRYGYCGGYQWIHKHTANKIDIGAGVAALGDWPDPEEIVKKIANRNPAVGADKLRGGGGKCLVGPPLFNFAAPGFLVIGDAASMAVPTTGCGTGTAFQAAIFGGKVIAEAARERRNDLAKLWDFNSYFYRPGGRGSHLAALAAVRIMLQNISQQEINDLYHYDLLKSVVLEKMVKGEFYLPNALDRIKALFRGAFCPKLLVKLSRLMKLAFEIFNHYQDYPQKWNRERYFSWREEAEELFSKARNFI